MDKAIVHSYPSERDGAEHAHHLVTFIQNKKGQYLRDSDGSLHVIIEKQRVLKVSDATIRRRRLLRQPRNWVKIGASVRYRPADIAAWIDSGAMGREENKPNRRGRLGVSQ